MGINIDLRSPRPKTMPRMVYNSRNGYYGHHWGSKTTMPWLFPVSSRERATIDVMMHRPLNCIVLSMHGALEIGITRQI